MIAAVIRVAPSVTVTVQLETLPAVIKYGDVYYLYTEIDNDMFVEKEYLPTTFQEIKQSECHYK